jgi:hypothetical protein
MPARLDVVFPAGPASNSRIHPLWAHSVTFLPRPSFRFKSTPRERNSLMISRWELIAAGAPDPPRPVFCTARWNGVDPDLFLVVG